MLDSNELTGSVPDTISQLVNIGTNVVLVCVWLHYGVVAHLAPGCHLLQNHWSFTRMDLLETSQMALHRYRSWVREVELISSFLAALFVWFLIFLLYP